MRGQPFTGALLGAVEALARDGCGAVEIGRRLGIERGRASAAVRRLRADGRLDGVAPLRKTRPAAERAAVAAAALARPGARGCNLCGQPCPEGRFVRFCDDCRAGGLEGAAGLSRHYAENLAW